MLAIFFVLLYHKENKKGNTWVLSVFIVVTVGGEFCDGGGIGQTDGKESFMTEKRRYKRLDLDVSLEMERLDEEGMTTLKYAHVEVKDISRSGIGFTSKQKLEIGSYYDAKIQIWTKEVIDAVIEIVRSDKEGDGYHYGGVFIGMMDTDALKTDIYQIFNDK